MRKGIKCVQLQKSRLPRRHYRDGIPNDCRNCTFWLKAIDSCSRVECFYLIEDQKKVSEDGERLGPTPDCRGCPYGKERPCIGYCIKRLYEETVR